MGKGELNIFLWWFALCFLLPCLVIFVGMLLVGRKQQRKEIKALKQMLREQGIEI